MHSSSKSKTFGDVYRPGEALNASEVGLHSEIRATLIMCAFCFFFEAEEGRGEAGRDEEAELGPLGC